MKFVQLANSLKEALAPVYLIDGEEAYFRDHAVQSIRETCALSLPELNDIRREGEELRGDRLRAFRDELRVLPMLDERRLVRIYEFYPTEREWSVLAPYVADPCPSTVLVIVNGGGKRAGSVDLRRNGGVTCVDCGRESEEMLGKWLYSLMRRKGLAPDADAVSSVVNFCARDAARMYRETEKLRLLLGEGGRVTRAVVEENVAKDAEYKIYELTQAASRKNFSVFSEILRDLLSKGYDENAVLAALTAHYRTLAEVSRMRGTDAELSAVLGIKPYAVQKNRELAARLGVARVKELYTALYALSCRNKSGLLGKTGAFDAAIAEIFFG